jgi:uncharacterized protein (TIGR02996 family)
MRSVETELAAALAALASDDDAQALEHLVAAWQHARVEHLARLIDSLARRVEPRTPALSGRTANDRYNAFMTTASSRRQADLASLVTALPKLAYGDVSTAMDFLLYEWPPSPRLPALLDLVQLSGYGDRVAELRKVHGSTNDAALSPDASARSTELERQLTDKADLGDELLAQIYADPDADAPRLVYADWATSRGDPRGELISLQFARRDRPPTPTALRRERELLDRYMQQWLAPIWHAVRSESVLFARGFVSSVVVQPFAVITPSPEWATVSALQLAYHDALPMQAFPGLRELRGVTPQLLSQIANQTTRLAHIGLADEPGTRSPIDRFKPLWQIADFPALRSIGIWGSFEEYARLWELGHPIERVELVSTADAPQWLRASLPRSIRTVCVGCVRFSRVAGAWSEVEITVPGYMKSSDTPGWFRNMLLWIPHRTLHTCRVVVRRRVKQDTVERLEGIVRRGHPELERFSCEVDPFA